LLLCILHLPAAAPELEICWLTSMSKCKKHCCVRSCPHSVYQSIFLHCIARDKQTHETRWYKPILSGVF
jgi:hypothetical protein